MAAVIVLPAAAADDALALALDADALAADADALAAELDELEEQPTSARPAPAAAIALPATNERRDKFFFMFPPVSFPGLTSFLGHVRNAHTLTPPIIRLFGAK